MMDAASQRVQSWRDTRHNVKSFCLLKRDKIKPIEYIECCTNEILRWAGAYDRNRNHVAEFFFYYGQG